jgi:hypothetical protein
LSRRVAIAVWALAAFHALAFVALAAVRARYPYELSWQEGNMLAMCARVLAHQPLYVAPSLDYVPFLYPPLYFQISAAIMRVTGEGYAAMRLVSIVSTLGIAAALYRLARRDGGRTGGVIAAGVFLGFYSRASCYYDEGRVDALAAALLVASLTLLFGERRFRLQLALAGLCGALSILSKQSGLPFVLAAGAIQMARGRRRDGLAYLACAAIATVGLLERMGLLFEPWLYYYDFVVPSKHHLGLLKLATEVAPFLAGTLPIALWVAFRRAKRSEGSDPWTAMLAITLALGALMRVKDGGSNNHFIPAATIAALQLGRRVQAAPWGGKGIALQLAMLLFPLTLVWPTRRDVEAGDRVVAAIRAIPGDVYVPALPAYAVRAGKPWHAHYSAMCDLAQFDLSLRDQLAGAVKAGRFAAVLPRTDVQAQDVGLCDVPGLDGPYAIAQTLELPTAPSVAEVLAGKPSLFGLVHAGKLGPIWRRVAP